MKRDANGFKHNGLYDGRLPTLCSMSNNKSSSDDRHRQASLAAAKGAAIAALMVSPWMITVDSVITSIAKRLCAYRCLLPSGTDDVMRRVVGVILNIRIDRCGLASIVTLNDVIGHLQFMITRVYGISHVGYIHPGQLKSMIGRSNLFFHEMRMSSDYQILSLPCTRKKPVVDNYFQPLLDAIAFIEV